MSVIYSELEIDGVLGDIYDKAALHEDTAGEQIANLFATSAAIKQAFVDLIYPVGSYKITDDSRNPSTYLGGTWVPVQGKFLLGADAQYEAGTEGGSSAAVLPRHTHSATVELAEGGAHTHGLTLSINANGAHNHQNAQGGSYNFLTYKGTRSTELVGQISGELNKMAQVNMAGTFGGSPATASAGSHTHSASGSANTSGSEHSHTATITVAPAGSDVDTSNMPPYRAVYIWKRTV